MYYVRNVYYGGKQIKAENFASSLFHWIKIAAMKKTTIIPRYIGYDRINLSYEP